MFSPKQKLPRKKSLCGIFCILTGLIVLLLFVPEWLLAIVMSFILIAIGITLLGVR